jgi:hypothetical protein
MIRALRNKEYDNPNLGLALFSELANIQPITPAGMPKKYWENPNARFFYTLRSFQIKYLNQIRQHVQAGLMPEGKRGTRSDMTRTEALTGLAGLVGLTAMMGVPVSYLKDAMVGKDPDLKDWEERMTDELWKATGFLSKYEVNKFGETSAPQNVALEMLAPPIDPFAPPFAITTAIVKGERPSEWSTREALRNIPLFGQIMEAWGPTPFLKREQDKGIQGKLNSTVGEWVRERFPVDPLGAMYESPDAWTPGRERDNLAAWQKKFQEPQKEMDKEFGTFKEETKWWQDAR